MHFRDSDSAACGNRHPNLSIGSHFSPTLGAHIHGRADLDC